MICDHFLYLLYSCDFQLAQQLDAARPRSSLGCGGGGGGATSDAATTSASVSAGGGGGGAAACGLVCWENRLGKHGLTMKCGVSSKFSRKPIHEIGSQVWVKIWHPNDLMVNRS